MTGHKPVLANEVLQFFEGVRIRRFCDGTLGLGGHAALLLAQHPEIEAYFGIDRDGEALLRARENLAPFDGRVHFLRGGYEEANELLQGQKVDGFLLDLGVSSIQLDMAERGFSFRKDAPLDMRMDRRQEMTAQAVINRLTEKKLGTIFRELGEESGWRRAAQAIVQARGKKKIGTTGELRALLLPFVHKGKKIDPLTRVFQALRIYVNDELGQLERGLKEAIALINPEGRIGVISFHSLEDRIVKQCFREAALRKEVEVLTKKPLVPTAGEIKNNKRARSAKLRFARKII